MSSDRHPQSVPGQKQEKHPGEEYVMDPPPQYEAPWYKGTGKLKNKVAIITGGDSGIGRAVAVLYAREGAKLVIVYLDEDKDAKDTQSIVEKEGSEALLIRTDISVRENCKNVVDKTIKQYGKLDILVNHAGYQKPCKSFNEITEEQLQKTFSVNLFSMFYLTQFALEHMKEGSVIINTSSVTAYRGHKELIDYAASNGAITTFTRSLATHLAEKKIRVNSVAPGPIWTPFIPSSFGKELSKKKIEEFGTDVLLGRPGQPEECAPAYVFLATQDSSYYTGQCLHPNGGDFISA